MRKEKTTYKKLDLLNQTEKASLSDIQIEDKLKAFSRLEESRKKFSDSIDYDAERNETMNEKYSIID